MRYIGKKNDFAKVAKIQLKNRHSNSNGIAQLWVKMLSASYPYRPHWLISVNSFWLLNYNLSSTSSSITWQPAPASVQRRVASSPATTTAGGGLLFGPALGGSPLHLSHDAEYELRSATSSVLAPAVVAVPSLLPCPCPSSYSESHILSRHRLASFTNKKGNRSSGWPASTFQLSCGERPSGHM